MSLGEIIFATTCKGRRVSKKYLWRAGQKYVLLLRGRGVATVGCVPPFLFVNLPCRGLLCLRFPRRRGHTSAKLLQRIFVMHRTTGRSRVACLLFTHLYICLYTAYTLRVGGVSNVDIDGNSTL
jgi:hypothetical protein